MFVSANPIIEKSDFIACSVVSNESKLAAFPSIFRNLHMLLVP